MKKRLIALFPMFILGVTNSVAQEWDHEYIPFVQEGKVWNCKASIQDNHDPYSIDCIFTMHGDTVIADQTYKKVLCQYEIYYGDKDEHYYCGVREDSYRVFIVEPEDKEEKLLFDFHAPKDTLYFTHPDFQYARFPGWHFWYYPDNQFEFWLCVIVDGKPNINYRWGIWIEGAGFAYGNPFTNEYYRDEHRLQPTVIPVSCMMGDKCLYFKDWTAQPTISVNDINTDVISKKHIFDLQGRPLSTPPSHGLYIQDGKKVWVK